MFNPRRLGSAADPSRTLAGHSRCYTFWFCVPNGLRRNRRAATKAAVRQVDGVVRRTGTMKTLVTRRQALAATSALALGPFAATAGEPEKVGMQLILAADVSGSVNATRYKTQQDGYLEALGDSRVLNVIAELDPPVLAIAFVAWAREQEVMVPWMRVQDAKSMDLFRNRLSQAQRPQIGINTLIGRALLFCDARFDQEFTGGRKVIDVSGDGDDNQGIAALRA